MSRVLYEDFADIQPKLAGFCQKLRSVEKSPRGGMIGYDGFIDTFIRILTPSTMDEFGTKVHSSAGIATSVEVRRDGVKYGGNGPLMTVALDKLFKGNIDLDYVGAIGYPEVHEVFAQAFNGSVRLHSFANPATTDCLEFTDGKVMLSDIANCETLTWAKLIDIIGEDTLRSLVQKSDFVASVNWSRFPHATEMWTNMAKMVAEEHAGEEKKLYYMDLAEFDIRTPDEIATLIPMIKEISTLCKGVISLNLKEGWQLAQKCGGDFSGNREPSSIADCADFIREQTGLAEVIIHPNDGAVISREAETVYVRGPYCSDPLISTGAGDHFGSGAMAAQLLELDGFESMLLGVCTSGYFVRTGISPSLQQICEMVDMWAAQTLGDRIE